jgi:trk system potassium uptake protein TrkH
MEHGAGPQRPVVRQSGELRVGTHVGDRRLRVARRAQAQQVEVPRLASRARTSNPAVVFIYGFALLILVGTVVLTLPLSSADGAWTPFLDALFTSTSAVCVTGLVIVDTGTYWSGFGQAVILALMKIGGLGFMTSSTLLLMLAGARVSIRERLLLREALGGATLGSVLHLARRITLFTLVAEGTGALILTAVFLREVDLPRAMWWGLFHSISAFNNAGFDLFGGFRSLSHYSHDAVLLLTIGGLILLGAVSYTAVEDLVRCRRVVRLTLDTKLILVTMAGLTVAGTLGLLFTERANQGTLAGMELGPRVLNAFFLTISRTAGFASVNLGDMTDDGLFLLLPLMFIGGASGSVAGGIKLQTFGLLLFAILSAGRGLSEVEAFRRRVPMAQVLRALSVALLAVSAVFVAGLILTLVEPFEFHTVLFEAVSAFGTVGYSTGITPDTGASGRLMLIAAMFAGRLGPLTLVIALAARERRPRYHWAEEPVKIG